MISTHFPSTLGFNKFYHWNFTGVWVFKSVVVVIVTFIVKVIISKFLPLVKKWKR